MIEMIMVLLHSTWAYQKIWLSKARCSHAETFIIIPGPPDGKTHNQIGHILLDMGWHSRIQMYGISGELSVILIAIWWFKFRKSITVSKKAFQNWIDENFTLRKLNELEVRKEYEIENTNNFAALENLSVGKDINSGLENIKEDIKISAKIVCLQEFKATYSMVG